MNVLKELFQVMVQQGASDLYLRTKAIPRARINGEVRFLGEEAISKQEMMEVNNFLLSFGDRKASFDKNMGVDFIHEEEGIGRFRINIFMQRQTPALVARHVMTQTQSFEDLNLPADLCRMFCDESKGLFLVCGPAGNGKSTTLASMVEYINQTQSKHVITIEDPIEFLFKDAKSIINQRELEIDVPTYPMALKHVTQQSPDIIYIGNIRDVETMRAAITATELGTFVMSTFHTVNTVQTITRIVNFFPPYLHEEVRVQLSMILKGIVSLRLLPRKDGNGRIPAYETMVVTPTIARLIREGRIREIQNYIDDGQLVGMQSFKQSLVDLVKKGLVEEKVARQYSDSKDDFTLALRGMTRD